MLCNTCTFLTFVWPLPPSMFLHVSMLCILTDKLCTLDEDDFSSANDMMEDCYPARVGYGMYFENIMQQLPVQIFKTLHFAEKIKKYEYVWIFVWISLLNARIKLLNI